MLHFTPTLGIKETSENAKTFVKDNMDVFWDVFKPLIPYIVGLYCLDILITSFLMPTNEVTGQPYEFPLGQLIAGYFYTCLAITWHRIVIHGDKGFMPMNPFKPQRSELAFVGMGILIYVLFFLCGALVGLSSALIHKSLFMLIFPTILFGIYGWMKIMFYFPAKATGRHIPFKQSWAMTKGYVWKMIASSFLAIIKLLLLAILYSIVGGIIVGILVAALTSIGISLYLAAAIAGTLFLLPFLVYFQPLFTILWVTILSNYYQYVMQNGPIEPSETSPTNADF